MKIYDFVTLNTQLSDLAENGINKGCSGFIMEKIGDSCVVVFMNDKNYGDYATATVDERYLTFALESPFPAEEYMKFVAKNDYKSHTKLKPCKVKEYDWVEMIVEKERYTKEGVHKGMVGCVMVDYAIQNEWYVIFTGGEMNEVIADICVNENDFVVIE